MNVSVFSDTGTALLDLETGYIVSADEGLDPVLRDAAYDVAEVARHYGGDIPSTVDILDLGYWYNNGKEWVYESPATRDRVKFSVACSCEGNTGRGHKSGCNSYKGCYPEVSASRKSAMVEVSFPSLCPGCGAPCVKRVLATAAYECLAEYACGGNYSHKSQIQTHSWIWWGCCGVRR